MNDRRRHIEREVGVPLPTEYRQFLESHVAKYESGLRVDSASGTYDLRQIYELGEGSKTQQLDEVFRLVADVIPPHTLPFAADSAGNLFLLQLKGPDAGHVSWWDHERDIGDISVRPIASSFAGFMKAIRRECE